MSPAEYNGAMLAYLGDAVLELLVRTAIIKKGVANVGNANVEARRYVTAHSQSEAVARILPLLTNEENAIYRRGRNCGSSNIPPSASAGEYRRASGLEALFAGLYLEGKTERMKELFDSAFNADYSPGGMDSTPPTPL